MPFNPDYAYTESDIQEALDNSWYPKVKADRPFKSLDKKYDVYFKPVISKEVLAGNDGTQGDKDYFLRDTLCYILANKNKGRVPQSRRVAYPFHVNDHYILIGVTLNNIDKKVLEALYKEIDELIEVIKIAGGKVSMEVLLNNEQIRTLLTKLYSEVKVDVAESTHDSYFEKYIKNFVPSLKAAFPTLKIVGWDMPFYQVGNSCGVVVCMHAKAFLDNGHFFQPDIKESATDDEKKQGILKLTNLLREIHYKKGSPQFKIRQLSDKELLEGLEALEEESKKANSTEVKAEEKSKANSDIKNSAPVVEITLKKVDEELSSKKTRVNIEVVEPVVEIDSKTDDEHPEDALFAETESTNNDSETKEEAVVEIPVAKLNYLEQEIQTTATKITDGIQQVKEIEQREKLLTVQSLEEVAKQVYALTEDLLKKTSEMPELAKVPMRSSSRAKVVELTETIEAQAKKLANETTLIVEKERRDLNLNEQALPSNDLIKKIILGVKEDKKALADDSLDANLARALQNAEIVSYLKEYKGSFFAACKYTHELTKDEKLGLNKQRSSSLVPR